MSPTRAPAKRAAKKRTTAKRPRDDSRTPFEIVVVVASIVAITAVVAGLVMAGLRQAPPYPDLRATVVRQSDASGGVAYRVRVRNVGGRTAEAVVVEVAVGDETREVQIAAVVRFDEETATVVFPFGTLGAPSVRILGYSEPAR